MVKEHQLLDTKKWFETYTGTFFSGVEKHDSAIGVKVRHTKNVAIEIIAFSNSSKNTDRFSVNIEPVEILVEDLEQTIRKIS
jgi:hypothetical protein